MIRLTVIFASFILLSACVRYGGAGDPNFVQFRPAPGQGQYVRPAYLNPVQPPRLPPDDICRSRLYAGLVGRHEGAIFFAGLPGRKRVLKPAFIDGFNYEPDDTFYLDPPLVEVREFLPDQVFYGPSIQTVTDPFQLGPIIEERLTLELDREGYIEEVRCG